MRHFRTLLLLLAALLITLPAFAERADDAERKSKNGMTAGEIDGVSVTLEYGRPHVRERAIWGALVPYGEVWRTGADEATTLTLSHPVTIEDTNALDKGTYSLFTIPTEDSWTVIFNRVDVQWGAYEYDKTKDALRIEVEPMANDDHVEELEFVIEGDEVVLLWEKVKVPFSVAAAQ